MATIRTRFRAMFASWIILLLVLCSLGIWFLAQYIIRQQAQAQIRHDVNRLKDEIVWHPQLRAFQLRPTAGSILHPSTLDYWQITDPDGRIVWQSDPRRSYRGDIPFSDQDRPSPAFEIPAPNGKSSMLASVRDVTVDETSAPPSMVSESPPAVRETLRRVASNREIIATELEFEEEQFTYEVITRLGSELLEFEISQDGQILSQTRHTVPTSLPASVSDTFEKAHPGGRIESFDWRASQGYLQFIVSGKGPAGEQFSEAINSSGHLIPLYFPPNTQSRPESRFRILVAEEQRWRHGIRRQLGWLLASVCGSGLIAAWLLSVWLADKALQPIGAIARKARLIDERRLSERLTGGRPEDEIGLLVQAINGMLDRIEGAFERQRRFARDASHELRGPLTGLIAQLELARGQLSADGPGAAHLDRALERGQRLRDLIDKLLLLARQESDQPVSMRDDLDIGECIANVVADFPDGDRERIRLKPLDGRHDGLFSHGNEELLHAMFRNIIDNALKFSGPAQYVDVSLQSEEGSICVEVHDRGPGIPGAARERIFEPFVRLREPSAAAATGSGLGLSIVKWIAALHQARLEVQSEPGEGTRFRVLLPEARDDQSGRQAGPA